MFIQMNDAYTVIVGDFVTRSAAASNDQLTFSLIFICSL